MDNNLLIYLAIASVGFFIIDGIALVINNIQGIIYDARNQKREAEYEAERAKRDEAYHQKLMDTLNK